MSHGKCSLLKPVDNLTGTFFLFSQYAQDLTEQYSNPDSYRCVPSKFIALNLDYSALTDEHNDVKLGEIFENYFENACTFLRGEYEAADTPAWEPPYALTMLFQTLEKYGFLKIDNDGRHEDPQQGITSGYSENIQYIGDINIYSFDNNEAGEGYNEIYCYIPNTAKSTKYVLTSTSHPDPCYYSSNKICGYESGEPYNGLSWDVDGYTDIESNLKCYAIGRYGDELQQNTLIPQCLIPNTVSNDQERDADKFDVNTIVVLYDVVSKENPEQNPIYKNIPLGIYFTGHVEDGQMTNTITKYVNSGQIYNQGTSYGLRICTRFLSTVNSTEIENVDVTGSSNVAEMAPVLEKIGETLMSINDYINEKDEMYQLVKDHLAQFKNNKVNVPYVRQLGNRKYWFVNGKNTGAVAEFEENSPYFVIDEILRIISADYYNIAQIHAMFKNYYTKSEIEAKLANAATTNYIDEKIQELRNDLRVWEQDEPDEEN